MGSNLGRSSLVTQLPLLALPPSTSQANGRHWRNQWFETNPMQDPGSLYLKHTFFNYVKSCNLREGADIDSWLITGVWNLMKKSVYFEACVVLIVYTTRGVCVVCVCLPAYLCVVWHEGVNKPLSRFTAPLSADMGCLLTRVSHAGTLSHVSMMPICLGDYCRMGTDEKGLWHQSVQRRWKVSVSNSPLCCHEKVTIVENLQRQ